MLRKILLNIVVFCGTILFMNSEVNATTTDVVCSVLSPKQFQSQIIIFNKSGTYGTIKLVNGFNDTKLPEFHPIKVFRKKLVSKVSGVSLFGSGPNRFNVSEKSGVVDGIELNYFNGSKFYTLVANCEE